jgi:ferric-dicitrate binding protein FerR (iron transport regulator)
MKPPESESSVERLIKLAGEPDLPSTEGMRRAREASERAWRQMLNQPSRAPVRGGRFLALGFGLAASVALVAWLVVRPVEVPPPPGVIGRVVVLQGAAQVRNGEDRVALIADAPIESGSTVETDAGGVAISLGTALSLRLDSGTRVEFVAADRVKLLAGGLYVDSGGINAAAPLRILTPAGEVSHIGTQFQVRVVPDITRVQVREGRVRVEPVSGAVQSLATGDGLEVRGQELVVKHGLPTFGGEWTWASTLAPVLEIENRPLAEFLAWLVREQGWRLHYASESLQEQAAQIRLHGSLEGLPVDAMLERVSLVTGVRLEVRHGVLWVGA